jgi:ornithine carbamoyltransferase
VKASHLLTIGQLTSEEIQNLLIRAGHLKTDYRQGKRNPSLEGKTLGLFFSKPSTRTRVSFEAAVAQLGGSSLFLTAQDLQVSRGESIYDTAMTLSRYLDAMVIRAFAHKEIEAWAQVAQIPVINGLTDLHHPCQGLGDLFTAQERFGSLKGLIMAYIGDGNNVAHSLIEGAAITGMTLRLACPKGFEPEDSIVLAARQVAKRTGAQIEILKEPRWAAQEADILYTDVWVSMGQERESRKRQKLFKPYQISRSLLKGAKPTACVMHCLPAHRGQEIAAEVMDGPQSIVWDQAENRLHVQKAILEWLLL